MASIERRTDGKWRARWREVPGGPQKTRHFERKIDAQRFLDGIVGDLARGTYVDPSAGRETFGEYARAWAARQVHRPSTAALVESHLRRHVLPAFESKPLAAVRRSDVQAWVKSKDGPLAPATLRVVYSFVAAIFQSAVEDRVLSASPCVRITLPKVTKKRVQPLPVEGVEAIVEAMPDRLQAAVLLAAATGLRQGEALGLTIDRVDWLRRTVTIDAAVGQLLTPDRGQPRLGPPKTASSARVVPLPQVAVDALAAHVAAFPVTHPWGLLFTTSTGQPVRRPAFAETFRAARRRADAALLAAAEKQGPKAVESRVRISDAVSFHDLRHFYASLLIRHGESVKVVQARLGHASAAETLDTYSHLWPDSEDLTRQAVDGVLGRREEDAPAAAGG